MSKQSTIDLAPVSWSAPVLWGFGIGVEGMSRAALLGKRQKTGALQNLVARLLR